MKPGDKLKKETWLHFYPWIHKSERPLTMLKIMKKVSAGTICTCTSPRTIQIMIKFDKVRQLQDWIEMLFFYARLHLLTLLQCGPIIGEGCLYWCM